MQKVEPHKLQLSHVLYRVRDLHLAVNKLQKAGFIVEYGTNPAKAYNALIWFEEGAFIEIYCNSGLPLYVKWLMKIFGYQPVLERIRQWENVGEGWCEWCLESTMDNLNSEKQFFYREKIDFKFHRAKRKDRNGNILKWNLIMPDDINFPFLMSAYTPDPKPEEINHPNGIKGLKSIQIGKENLNIPVLNRLLTDQSGLEFVSGKGLQTVAFIGSDLTIEDALKN